MDYGLSRAQGTAPPQLATASGGRTSIDASSPHAHLDHCGYSPPGRPGLQGQGLLHGRHPDLCARAARFRPSRKTPGTQPYAFKHQPAAALRASTPRADAAQPVGYNRPVPVCARSRGRVHQRRPSHTAPRSRESASPGRRCSLEATLAARPSGAARSDEWSTAFDVCCWVDLRGRRTRQTAGGERLAGIVSAVAARSGKLVIPAFAIGRVEEVIYWLKQLEERSASPCPSSSTVRWQPGRCSSTRSAPTNSTGCAS